MTAPTPLAILGASGRMGRSLLHCLAEFPQLRLSGALAGPESAQGGRDAGEAAGVGALGVALSLRPEEALSGAKVAVDFSLPQAVRDHAEACAAGGIALVCGVTGLDERAQEALRAASGRVPVLWAPNMSAGVAVLERLVKLAAAALGDFDAAVHEVHHAAKRDAPSGTALALGRAVAAGRGRDAGAVGYGSLRVGDVVGEHSVLLAGAGERLELVHRATDRAIFARGALRAAAWIAGRAPGMYSLGEALGLGRVDTPADGQ